jgi:enoyl-CoA hydratase
MIEVGEANGIRVLRLAHGKASALDLELVLALRDAYRQADADKVRAVVLTGSGHIFCAGVDLFRIADGGATYVKAYLAAFAELMFTIFGVERPVVAALNGHAIAGGAVLVASADYRVMSSGGGRFGYTELLVGVPFPPAALEIVRFASPGSVQRLLLAAETFNPEQSLALNLVDELAAADAVLTRGKEVAERFCRVPPDVFAATKRHIRAETLRRMREAEEELGAAVEATWSSDRTRAHIRDYLARTVRQSKPSGVIPAKAGIR